MNIWQWILENFVGTNSGEIYYGTWNLCSKFDLFLSDKSQVQLKINRFTRKKNP